MLYEILRDTRAFQEMAKEGREEGLKEGREEGLKEGHKKGLQAALQTLVEARFPDSEAMHLLKEKADTIEDAQFLQRLIVRTGTAQSAEEVVMYLFKEFLDEDR